MQPAPFRTLDLAMAATCLLGLCLAGCASTAAADSKSAMTPNATQPEKVAPFLMFEGRAEEAMTFYISLFDDARITSIERYGPGEPGPEGSVRIAHFTLAGRPFMTIDSPAPHDFTFTPSISMFVTCESEAEFERLFEQLSAAGLVLMPPDDYGFSKRFTWVQDRFGVSWQLNWPGE